MSDRRKLNLIERGMENFAKSKAGSWFALNIANPVDRRLLKLTGGRLSLFAGQNVALLEHTGAKSGQTRKTPLLYMPVPDSDAIVLIASQTGKPNNPAWYHNLTANPECRLLIRDGSNHTYVARRAKGRERKKLWALANDYYAGYDTYADRTDREIPVMVLERQTA